MKNENQKVDFESKRHKDWVALKTGLIEYKNTPPQKQAFLNPDFNPVNVRTNGKPKTGTLAKLDDETWNALVEFSSSSSRITESQLDLIYIQNEITKEANNNFNREVFEFSFKNLKGVDFNNVVFNLPNLYQSVLSNIDGKWYFGIGQMIMLMRGFSNNTYKIALDDLMVLNGISLNDVKYNGEVEYWEGNGFNIESPPEKKGNRVIIITNENYAHTRSLNDTKWLEERLASINEQWNKILIARAELREISNDNGNDYWATAEGHCEEYMLRYKSDEEFNAENLYNRMDIYYKFISEFEVFYSKCQKSNKKIPANFSLSEAKKIDNRFFALIESLIGVELALLKMDELGEEVDLSKVFKIYERPNNDRVKDSWFDKNKDLVDVDKFTYYKNYLFNGVVTYFDKKNIQSSVTFKFGLKHGILKSYYKNGQIKAKTKYFYGKAIDEGERVADLKIKIEQ